MRGEHARLWTSGGWGLNYPPAFAYELTKGDLYKRAKSNGLRRYGRAPSSSDDDTRPLGLAYTIEWAISPTGNEMMPDVDSAPLTPLNNAFYNTDAIGLGHTDATANKPVAYSGLSVKRNGAWSLWGYIHTPPKSQVIRLQQWFCGTAGAGYVFQIRNGTAEIAGLSANYNEAEMNQLRVLWGVKDPTQLEIDQTEELKDKLFEDFESLSFENNTGKGDWYGNEFMLSFIPEDRGAVHVVLEGLDATCHEIKRILTTREEGIVNEEAPIRLWNGGGQFFFCLGYPRPIKRPKLFYGPFKNGYFVEHLGDLTKSLNASIGSGQVVSIEKVDIDAVHFGFEVTVQNDEQSWFWLYALSCRLAPGPRQPITEENGFDTDVVYVPASPSRPRYEGPVILDIEPSWLGDFNSRQAKVTMMDFFGTLRAGKASPLNRVATLEIKPGEPFITNGIVIPPFDVTDVSSLASDLPINTSLPSTGLVATVADGWEVLNTTECEPPPVGDGLPLGTHVRELLALAGYSSAEMAGVPHEGRRLGRCALGEDWASRADRESMVGDILRTLFDCYGLGWRFYQDHDGIWQMVRPSLLSEGSFSSSRAPSPLSEPGRLAILRDIDVTYDTTNFFNHIIVIGGAKGEIVGEYTDWASIQNPASPNFIGRRKTKRIINTGLRTQSDVNYCLRSAKERYMRDGRTAEYPTYFHRRFAPGKRIQADGSTWEIDSLSGGSWAKDQMRFVVREIVSP